MGPRSREKFLHWTLFGIALAAAMSVIAYVLKFSPAQAPAPGSTTAVLNPQYIPPQVLKAEVDAKFPAYLWTDGLAAYRMAKKQFPPQYDDFKSADLDGNGATEYVVAAYSDGEEATVRMFKKENGSITLLDPRGMPRFTGSFPILKLVDLTNDGVPEVVLYLRSASDGDLATWVFAWRNGTLQAIGPGTGGLRPTTLLKNAVFLDMTKDGYLEIVNKPQPDRNGVLMYQVFKYDAGAGQFVPFKVLRDIQGVG